MTTIIIFSGLSMCIFVLSLKSLKHVRSHGFFRFLSWECIAWLFAHNYRYWFIDPFSLPQVISWLFLIISGYFVLAGVIRMKQKGKAEKLSREENLFGFEATTSLVTDGIFRYIRHPLYSSLLFLTWGILLKQFGIHHFLVAVASTFFITVTALYDEKECMTYFGDDYIQYSRKTKRFIPWVI